MWARFPELRGAGLFARPKGIGCVTVVDPIANAV